MISVVPPPRARASSPCLASISTASSRDRGCSKSKERIVIEIVSAVDVLLSLAQNRIKNIFLSTRRWYPQRVVTGIPLLTAAPNFEKNPTQIGGDRSCSQAFDTSP